MDKSVPHNIVKSYADQRAEAPVVASFNGGIACPKCGCLHTMVTNTVRMFQQVTRYRQCADPKCRRKFVTKERTGK